MTMVGAVRIIGAVTALCSVVPLGIAGYWYQRSASFLERALPAQAQVVSIQERSSDDGTMYYPVFSFTDREGVEHTVHSRMGSNPPAYSKGEAERIFYDPRNPDDTRFDTFLSLWIGPVILGALGLIPIFLGAILFFAGPPVIGAIMERNRIRPDPPDAEPPEPSSAGPRKKDDRTWAMFCHLSTFSVYIGIPFGNIIGPLVIWLIKRDEFPLVNVHGRESLNFQISFTLYTAAALFLCLVFIGFLVLPVIVILDFVFVILATLKANQGETYRYPLTIRFVS
jgi:uncharacterized protein